MRRFLFVAIALVWSSTAFAACNVTTIGIKDGSGTPQTLCIGGASGAYLYQQSLVDSNNSALDAAPGTSTSHAIGVQGVASGVAVPVSGTITANAGTGGFTTLLGTTGGWTPGVATALSTTVTSIKASAGQLGKILCYNPNSAVAFVQIFNIASGSVTLGTSTALDVVPVPPTLNGGWTLPSPGEQFTTAISFAATTTPTGSTANSAALNCSYAYN